jgi:hypothetical protein
LCGRAWRRGGGRRFILWRALCRRGVGRRRRLLASGQVADKAKCTEIGWFAPDEVPEDLKQVTRVNLAHYRGRCLAEQKPRAAHNRIDAHQPHKNIPGFFVKPGYRCAARMSLSLLVMSLREIL